MSQPHRRPSDHGARPSDQGARPSDQGGTPSGRGAGPAGTGRSGGPAGGGRSGGPPRARDPRRESNRYRPPEDAARRAAFDAIATGHSDDAYAHLVLPPVLRERRPHGLGAALATQLTYRALR